jgi:hypothetical protein
MIVSGILKYRARHRVYVIPAKLTGIARLIINLIVIREFTAFHAKHAIRETFFKQPIKASIIVSKLLVKVFYTVSLHFHTLFLYAML